MSAYLAKVRRGESVTILDRKTPIARIVPAAGEPVIVVHHPNPGAAKRLRRKSKVRTKRKVDVVAVLLEERGSR